MNNVILVAYGLAVEFGRQVESFLLPLLVVGVVAVVLGSGCLLFVLLASHKSWRRRRYSNRNRIPDSHRRLQVGSFSIAIRYLTCSHSITALEINRAGAPCESEQPERHDRTDRKNKKRASYSPFRLLLLSGK